jgi:hypothetical protein
MEQIVGILAKTTLFKQRNLTALSVAELLEKATLESYKK